MNLELSLSELWRQETEAEDGKRVASANVEQILVKFRKVVPNVSMYKLSIKIFYLTFQFNTRIF